MLSITGESFKAHLESKMQKTKGDLAKEFYGPYTYDVALPLNWVNDTAQRLGLTYGSVESNFIWLYMGSHYEGPAPITFLGCDILSRLEALE